MMGVTAEVKKLDDMDKKGTKKLTMTGKNKPSVNDVFDMAEEVGTNEEKEEEFDLDNPADLIA